MPTQRVVEMGKCRGDPSLPYSWGPAGACTSALILPPGRRHIAWMDKVPNSNDRLDMVVVGSK